MKVRIEADGRLFDVQIDDTEDGPMATIEGDRFPLRVDRDGRTAVVWADADPVTVTVEDDHTAVIDGAETHFRLVSVQGVAGLSDKSGGDHRVRPPMNGKIQEVLVEEGATVEEGDVLFVLEAMKMRNEVKAPRAGTIAKVLVAPGDNVDPKKVAVELEA